MEFVVIPRPGTVAQPPPGRFRIRPLRGYLTAISSSEIRQRVHDGQPIHHLVPAPVAELIDEESLYRPTSSGTLERTLEPV